MPPRPPSRLLAVLAVLLALVAGCGGGKPHHATSSTPPSAGPSSDQPALDPGYGVPRVGQCFSMTSTQSRASVAAGRKVGCRRPHTTVVAFVGYVAKSVTPLTPVAERRAVARKVCRPAFRAIAGGTDVDRAESLLTWTLFTPGQDQLERGARWVRCDVLARNAGTLVPLPATTPLLARGVPEALRVCLSQGDADVSCAGPHAYRVAAVFQAVGSSYPGIDTQQARVRCRELTKTPGGYFQLPARAGWAAGDHFVRCLTGPQASPATTP